MPAKPKRIQILGAGSLGSNLALDLIADVPELELTVLDFDIVEARNFRTGVQVYDPEQEGMLKVEALQLLAYLKFDKDIETRPVKLGERNLALLEGYDLVVDCFDNIFSRQLVKEGADEKGYEVLHAGFSGLKTCHICWNEKYEVPDRDSFIDICELPGARSFIQSVSGLTSLVIQRYLRNAEKLEVFGSPLRIHTCGGQE